MVRRGKLPLSVMLVLLVSLALLPVAGASTASSQVAVTPVRSAAGLPAPQAPALEAVDGVRLLSSTGNGVTFEVAVPWERLSAETVTAGERSYVRLVLPGWGTTAEAGAPALPRLAQAIGVPFGVALRVQVEPGPAHTLALAAAAVPVATQGAEAIWTPGEDGKPALPQPSTRLEENGAVYGGGAPYPGVLAEVVTDGVVRQQRVAGIATYPVQYDPQTQQITIYESLRVEVRFEGAAAVGRAATESAAYEAVLQQQLLNYEAARAWRQQAVLPSPSGRGVGGEGLPWAPPVPGWRVKVRADGVYKLTYAELEAAELPVDTLDPRTFQMYHLGSEVEIQVEGEDDGTFDPADHLLFYGRAVASKYTRDNVYWLTYGHDAGQRMGARDGTPGAGTTPDYYGASQHLEQNVFYIPGVPGDENLERWLWDYAYPPSRPSWTYTFSLPTPYAGTYTATLRVAMLGGLDNPINPDHHTRLYLNGTLLEDAWWDGITWRVAEVDFPQSLLLSGNNTLSVVCPNDTGVGIDVVYIDWAELEFANSFVAAGDVLPFTYGVAGTWKYRVEGFGTSTVAVYDVTDPNAVQRIEGVEVVPSGAGYAALFEDEIAAPTGYWTVGSTGCRTVQAIEADTASDLQSPANGADYVLVTHAAFEAAAADLRDWRASQGLRASLVYLQDVYDEFGYGIVGAAAIHDFVAYAYGHWQAPAPSYAVLVGDGHYDPNNYLNYGRASYLPPYLAPVDPWIKETAADNRYVTVVGDDNLPDLMMGRLSVNSGAEASAMVNKIVGYEQSPEPGDWNQQVLAVADNADGGGDFAQISDALLSCCLPEPYQAETVYYGLPPYTTVAAARAAILAGINAGKLIVNYVGHGQVTAWAAEGLLKTSDVPALQNGGKLPVMLPMTCYDGYYHYPFPQQSGADALGEVVTRADGRGAVASWSPTGLGVATGHDHLDTGFFQAVFHNGLRTLGQATLAGKLKLWATGANLDLLDTYLLFGDPAMNINVLSVVDADLQISKAAEPEGPLFAGETLTYTLTFTNAGPGAAHQLVLSDPMPAQLINPEVVEASPGVLLRAGTTFVWDVQPLAAGSGGWVTVRGTVDPALVPPDTIANTAEIAGAEPDPVPENNDASVTTEVLPVMRVGPMNIKARPVSGGRYAIVASARIVDLGRVPVPGATVQAQWTFPDATTLDQEAIGGALGLVKFRLKSALLGLYQLCVTDVTKSGWIYVPERNVRTCITVTIP